MKSMKKIFCILIAITCLASTIPVMAHPMYGNIMLVVEDSSGKAMKNCPITVYKLTDDKNLVNAFYHAGYSFAQIWDESGNAKKSKSLATYAKQNNIAGIEVVTDSYGRAKISFLAKGSYLVVCSSEQGKTFAPFICYIPTKIAGQTYYDILAYPKVSEGGSPGGGGGGGGSSEPDKPNPPDEPVKPDEPNKPDDPNDPGNTDEPVNPDEPAIPVGPSIVPQEPSLPEQPTDPENPMGPADPSDPEHFSGQAGSEALGGFEEMQEQSALIIPQTGLLKWPMWVLCGLGVAFVLLGVADILKKERDFDE